jgi:hypothetical protein
MLKKAAVFFGIVFVIVGALGFVPAAAPHGHLLGVFHVNTFHNLVHILTGIVAIIAGSSSEHGARLFFRIFGLIYGLVAVLGFFHGDRPIFGILANNMADVWLHVAIAAVSLILGFAVRESHETRVSPNVP